MQNPFWSSARPRFANKHAILEIAHRTAFRIAREHPEVVKILVFGSFAREDYGVRSDLDLLIVLEHSEHSPGDRLAEFLRCTPKYPTDMVVLTQAELQARLAAGDPFLRSGISEGILVYPSEQN